MRVRQRITIAAPRDRVFAFFDDPANATLLLPSLVDVTSVDPLPNGGRRMEYVVRTRRGDHATASTEHVEYDPPRRTVSHATQVGLELTSTREFEEVPGGTRVTGTLEWNVAMRYVGPIITLPIRGPLRRAQQDTLRKAKAAIEG